MKRILIAAILITIFYLPISASAADILNIWKDTSGDGCNVPVRDSPTSTITNVCTFCDGLIVIRNIINFLFQIAIPIAVGVIVWGSIWLMTAGGNESRVKQGHETITNAVFGIFITLAAWVIINTILQILSGTPSFPWSEITC